MPAHQPLAAAILLLPQRHLTQACIYNLQPHLTHFDTGHTVCMLSKLSEMFLGKKHFVYMSTWGLQYHEALY